MTQAKRKDYPVGATATVTLTLEIKVSDSWGTDCSVAQIHRQASEAALHIVGDPKLFTAALQQGRIKASKPAKIETIITAR